MINDILQDLKVIRNDLMEAVNANDKILIKFGINKLDTLIYNISKYSEEELISGKKQTSVNITELSKILELFNELLEEAIYLYQYYPDNFKKTAEEYFAKEIEMQKKLNEKEIKK